METTTTTTTIANGKIQCARHGSLTAIDCDSLQDDSCAGCFIYMALNKQSIDLEEFSFNDLEKNKTTETIQ